MDTKFEKKKRGLPSKLRSTVFGWFSPCGKNAEEISIINEDSNSKSLLDFVTTTKSNTLISDRHKTGDDGCYVSEEDVAKTIDLREKIISKTLVNINRSMQVDLCFVLDCTISMGSYIAAAKDCILKVVDYIRQTNPNIKLWVGLCGYRDHCDGPNRLQIFNFTDSYSDFKDYISNKVFAIGGGDAPEDVLGGLDAAVKQMNWSHRVRVLLHIGDSPPHGRRFTNLYDYYPRGDPYGLTAKSVFNKIRSKNIFYHFGKITNLTDEMINVFRSIIGEFLVFDLTTNDKDPDVLIAKLFEAVCSSITSSVTLASTAEDKGAHKRQRKEFKMDPHEPDWNTIPIQTGKLLHYLPPKTMTDIKDRKYFEGKSNLIIQEFSYKHAPKPFSVGAERYAYFALNVTHESNEKIVIKESIDIGRKANSLERHLESVEVSTIAYFLSMEFNLAAARSNIDKKVNFLKAQVLCHTADSSTRCYTIEPKFHNAEFKRFNVNSGVIKEYHSILEAFAHFTYEHTEHYLVVYDLQGVELPDQFLLTDAAIHCSDPLRFGRTNFGKRGIENCFLANHKCGDVCQKLGLVEISKD